METFRKTSSSLAHYSFFNMAERMVRFCHSLFYRRKTRRRLLQQTICFLTSRNSLLNSPRKTFKINWPYLGSFLVGGFVGYQLHGFYLQKKFNIIDDFIASVTPCVSARAIPNDNSSSIPPSKRYNFIADAVETVAPAVVYIEVTDRRITGIFGHPAGPTSSGSGFFVSEEGMVLTNAHVVANARDVTVKLTDGREFKGVVVDIDPVKDLAAIMLGASQGTKFPTIKLGSSSSLRPGEWVVAMGSPLTLSNTITAGIVSTVHRGGEELGLPNRDMEYIQTDAAINVGNSGGPLVNLDGEVIGVSAITVKFAAGISFAIPIDEVKQFLKGAKEKKSLLKSGLNQRALGPRQRWYIGINMLTLLPHILDELQRRDSRFDNLSGGVFVAGVNYQSPAYVAGLRSGDIITKINGTKISTSKEVFEFVKKGEDMNMEVRRGTTTTHMTVQPQIVG